MTNSKEIINQILYTSCNSQVGIHRANFEVFILDLRNYYTQSLIYIGFTNTYRVLKSTLFIFGGKFGSF
jgi:hypothetical protein